ncbi:hypothetical protein BV20DRAFT_1036068 [Pilatotrama ljubarskyi]|nr:hypothetical protein BV20DRAFT_1036068 [Pilatotrama ljubarskyi]
MPKKPIAQPIPGLSKPARGRQVPQAGTTADPRRKYICPVETCKKAFTKRDHLNRHINTLHRYDADQMHDCHRPHCDFTASRLDNCRKHRRNHTHYQEIFACSPEDGFKGLHLQNPQTIIPEAVNIKPFDNISIPPLALNLWCFQEKQRRNGVDIPRVESSDVQRYFNEHPEEIESCLAGDPKWEWRMPPPGPEFTPINAHCMTGTFRVQVKREEDA